MSEQASVALVVLNNFKNDSRVLKEAGSLLSNGYDVKVLALHEEPLSEFEVISGISIHRIKLKTKHWSKNKMVQLIKYCEFLYKAIKQCKGIDVIHCNDLDALPLGFLLKKIFNKSIKIVYDAHEFEINQKPFQSKISIKVLYYIEKFLIQYVDQIFTVSKSIAQEYSRMYGIKPVILFNSPKLREVKKSDIFRQKFSIKKDSVIVLYQGGLSRGRGLELLIEAFKKRDDRVVIVFMGYGELESLIKGVSEKYNNIFFHPAVPPDVLLDYTAAATVAAVSYIYDSCLNYYYCMPNKFFEYTMVGLPVIVSNLKDLAQVVSDNGLGVIVDENTSESINLAIDKLLLMDFDQIKQNALKFSKEYSWERQERKLIESYDKLLKR